ncbi:TPA: hypothetical protein N0F65_000988 [Lagenidium giganteum]|uniref:Uncharacterized protein n=1 Tax=Lagenidium giganteum TaxID=4803 RepID=A0AAV2Z0C1_9STRA|nr:TPA: hypothetical protein N0F65_000988 [Lagenidium giganteum]
MVTFCPWVSFAQVTSRMGIAPYSKTLLLFLGLYIVLIILEILSPHSIIFTVQLRGRVRQRFEIPGSQCEDLLLSWCCGCCVMAQMATHVKSYQPGNCNFGPVDSLPPYNPGACMPAVPLRGSCLSFEL